MALTAKQALFVKEYLVDFNAGGAAVRAGYSENTAYAMGYENLRKPQISKAISEASEARHKHLEWTADEILKDIREIAQDRSKADKDRLKAYELGGKTLGMFKDKVELTGDEGGPLKVMFNIPRPQQ